MQERAAVLGDAEEPRAAAEQPGGQRALQRVGRGQVGEPGRDRGRGEAVVGQRDQHRLEDPGLRRRRAGAARPARRPARRSRPCPSGRRRGPGRAGGSRPASRCPARSGSSQLARLMRGRRLGQPAPDLVAVLVERRAAAAGSRPGSRRT